jgi:ABC-2 type transport system ATP-binding protein
MIQAQGLTKRFGPITAVEKVSFSVGKGEIVGFLGPNAAGKTTTMRILTGYLVPTEGQATVAGYDIVENSLEARRHIGYLPEDVPLYPEMTVRDYLAFWARLRQIKKAEGRIAAVIEQCALDGWENALIGRLSKGYRQRVGLAQALLHNPQVLILDEPTGGLDPIQIVQVRELIQNLAREHTVILSTHILSEVRQTCQRILIIHHGKLVAEGTPEELVARLKGSDQVLLWVERSPTDATARLRQLEGIVEVHEAGPGQFHITCAPGQDYRPAIATLAVQLGWGLLELRPADMTLEEVFIQLTGE